MLTGATHWPEAGGAGAARHPGDAHSHASENEEAAGPRAPWPSDAVTWFGGDGRRATAAGALADAWTARQAACHAPVARPLPAPLQAQPVPPDGGPLRPPQRLLRPRGGDVATGIALTSRYLGVGDSAGGLSVHDAATGERLHRREAHCALPWRQRPLQVFAMADDRLLTLPTRPGRHGHRPRLWLAEHEACGLLATLPALPGPASSLACVDRQTASAIVEGEASWRQVQLGAPANVAATPKLAMAAGSTEGGLLARVRGRVLALLRRDRATAYAALPWPGAVGATALAVGPAGVVVGDYFGGLSLWKLEREQLVLAAAVPGAHQESQVLRVALSGTVVASHGRDADAVQLRDARVGGELALLLRVPVPHPIGGLALAGEHLAVLLDGVGVALFTLTARRGVARAARRSVGAAHLGREADLAGVDVEYRQQRA